jgi:transmembrane sensor
MPDKSDINKDIQKEVKFDNLLSHLDSMELPKGRSKEDAWNLLFEKVERQENAIPVVTKFPLKRILSIAASIIIITGSWIAFRNLPMQTVTTENGQFTDVILPDSSKVKLNAGSTIKYHKINWKNNRRVIIRGEALFTVVKGNKFTVESDGKKVTVLGTSFNVLSRNKRFEVQCYTGKVRVELPLVQPLLLEKGDAVKTSAYPKSFNKYKFDPEQEPRWTKGEFYFRQEKLDVVFEELALQFNVTIQATDFNNRLYTGFFRKGNLKTALDNICLPMGITYEIADSNLIILK